jgi:hypothetical protein
MNQNIEKQLLDRIVREPSYRLVLYKILRFCETPKSAAEIEQEVIAYPEMKAAVLTPAILLGDLERAGGLERLVEAENDKWRITESGKRVVEIEAPGKRILALMSKEPEHSQLFLSTLEFCCTRRTRAEIEAWIKENSSPQTPQVHIGYVLQRLEDAGGIEWVDQYWQTTESGKGVIGSTSKTL